MTRGIYNLKTWLNETSKPKTRSTTYALAYALATRGGFYKAQIIDPRTSVIELEVSTAAETN